MTECITQLCTHSNKDISKLLLPQRGRECRVLDEDNIKSPLHPPTNADERDPLLGRVLHLLIFAI